jgi:hypothetical protein
MSETGEDLRLCTFHVDLNESRQTESRNKRIQADLLHINTAVPVHFTEQRIPLSVVPPRGRYSGHSWCTVTDRHYGSTGMASDSGFYD